jgi:hypothetical protein
MLHLLRRIAAPLYLFSSAVSCKKFENFKFFFCSRLSKESEACTKDIASIGKEKQRLADRGSVVSLSRIEKGGKEA